MQPILVVDLTTGAISTRSLPGEWQEQFLGGASLAARMLFDHLVPELQPLSPPSPLLFLTGPLTGTSGPAVGRFVVAARSPATGLWAESNCGGFWGPALRQTGFDGIWITGRSAEPVYLWVTDRGVELRPAKRLLGMDTAQTQVAIQAELGQPRARVAAIGLAGEAELPFALILCDHGRVAGRTGMGAVMGAKNLKAIAVYGRQELPVARPDEFAPLRGQANRDLRSDSFTDILRLMGSSGGGDYFDYLGVMPKRYYQVGEFDGAAKVTGASVAETIQVGVSTCHACVVACGRVVRLEDGRKRKGPEYETLVGFGPNLWIDDPSAITRLGELCDRYGMDTISLSNTIGLAFKLYEQGRIPAGDTGGLELLWGDAQLVEQLIHQTVRREGFGAYLAEGSLSLARRYDAEGEAVQVNGLELAYHDPRGASGMALVYATSPRGGCHNQSDYFMVDIGQVEESLGIQHYPRQGGPEKAANVALHQDWITVRNAMVICFFANVPPRTTVALVNAVVGLDWTLEDLLLAGQRAWNLKRAINVRLGLRSEHDRLPEALLRPIPDGGSAGFVPKLPAMLDAYYRVRGWDPQSGIPRPATLQALDLDWVVDERWPGS